MDYKIKNQKNFNFNILNIQKYSSIFTIKIPIFIDIIIKSPFKIIFERLQKYKKESES